MDREKMKQLNLTPIEDLIEEDFGKEGTPSRLEFENGCDAFIIGERLKEERLRAGLTQEQLASRIGTKKAYISRVENGHTDVQVSTLFKIFEGLGRRISINISKDVKKKPVAEVSNEIDNGDIKEQYTIQL